MSTIRVRKRWIRAELCVITALALVLIFPDSPRRLKRAILASPVYERAQASIMTSSLRKRIEEGDPNAVRLLAWSYATNNGYHRFMKGDAEALLQPLVEEGDIQSIRLLAWVVGGTDPDRAERLYLQAADLGDEYAQARWLRTSGLRDLDTTEFMRRLRRLQDDRPGWRMSYERYEGLLRQEADSGNEAAVQVLNELERSDEAAGT